MTIAILLPDLRGGGAERVSLALAYEFARSGMQVEFVLAQAQGDLLPEASRSFEITDLGCGQLRGVLPTLARYLRRRAPSALIANMWPMTCLAPMARLLSGQDCKILVAEHNMLSRQYVQKGAMHFAALRASMVLGYRLADARVGVSEGVVQELVRLSGLRRERFRVVHNPVPMNSEPSSAALATAETFWGGGAGPRIINVGSLKPQKNQSLLLRAFARLARSDARLMFLGAGGLETELRELAAALGIADRVIFAGFHPDPTPFYHTADLFVLSSDYEGFANVIVEALACGKPVVSTNCPSGPSEILDDGRYGRLVPPADAESLTSAMDEAVERLHDPQQLRARAREFAPEKAARAYLELLGFEEGKDAR